ncbi:MAG: hypothetical protein LBB89_10930 [Treponema sp.]|jgi:translation initiation factor 2 alpha subunit (eIF-2alpha)|nr:hypothetical protein [Treponema sp.]
MTEEEKKNDDKKKNDELPEKLFKSLKKDNPDLYKLLEDAKKDNPNILTQKDPRYAFYKEYIDQIDNSVIQKINPEDLQF